MTEKRRIIHTGEVVNLGLETVTLPNGKRMTLEVVRHPGGAAIAAIDGQQRVCLLRQYRHAAGGWLWELPAGKLEPGEAPHSTAARELAEEAGLEAGHWVELGSTVMTPGFCDEVIHLFLATELRRVPTQHHAHELIEIHWIPLHSALGQCRDGTIRDAKTSLGLLLAALHLGHLLSNKGTPA